MQSTLSDTVAIAITIFSKAGFRNRCLAPSDAFELCFTTALQTSTLTSSIDSSSLIGKIRLAISAASCNNVKLLVQRD